LLPEPRIRDIAAERFCLEKTSDILRIGSIGW
jgi:hypothetical protein